MFCFLCMLAFSNSASVQISESSDRAVATSKEAYVLVRGLLLGITTRKDWSNHQAFYLLPVNLWFFWSSMIIRVSMCLILFVHLLLYPFIELSITSIYPSIYRSIHWSSCLLWIHRSICLPLKQSTDQSTNRSFIPSFIHSVSQSFNHSFLPSSRSINQSSNPSLNVGLEGLRCGATFEALQRWSGLSVLHSRFGRLWSKSQKCQRIYSITLTQSPILDWNAWGKDIQIYDVFIFRGDDYGDIWCCLRSHDLRCGHVWPLHARPVTRWSLKILLSIHEFVVSLFTQKKHSKRTSTRSSGSGMNMMVSELYWVYLYIFHI